MFDDDDVKPIKRKIGGDLSALSIGDLDDYVAELEAEIARARTDQTQKQTALGGAKALFKRP